MLSPRHVGWNRVGTLSGKTLEEYCSGKNITFINTQPSDTTTTTAVTTTTLSSNNPITQCYGLNTSKQIMSDLGLITLDEETGSWVPSEEWELLSFVWELRGNMKESITLGRLLPSIIDAVEKKTVDLLKQMQSGNRATKV